MLSASQWVSLQSVYFCGGLAGPSGPQGRQGPTGPSGATGPSSYSGPTGSSGATGSIGSNGGNGMSGNFGVIGASGIANIGVGAIGPTGPVGLIGIGGVTGPTGPTGISKPGLSFVTSDIIINPPGPTGAGIPASGETYVYTFTNFLENNTDYAGHYRFISYLPNTSTSDNSVGHNVTGNSVIYDFIIFPIKDGVVSYIPVKTPIGTPAMKLYENTLYVGFVAPTEALTGYILYRWELSKFSMLF